VDARCRVASGGLARGRRGQVVGRRPFIGAGAAALVYLLIVGLRPAGAVAMITFGDLALLAPPLFGAVACVVAYRRVEGSARYGWALIGAGMAAWALGQVLWSFNDLVLHQLSQYPSLADVGYLLNLPLMIAGIAGLLTTRYVKLRTLLDVPIILASLLFVSWAFIIGPKLQAAGGSGLEVVLGLVYPVGDVAMVTLALMVLSHVDPGQRFAVGLVAAGALGLSISHGAYMYLIERDAYVVGTLVDFGWFGGFLLMGLGALSVRAGPMHSSPEQNETLCVVLPLLPLAVAIITSIVLTVRYGWIGTFLFYLEVLIVVLVAARQLTSLRDNLALTRRLGAAVQDLRMRERQLYYLAFHDELTDLANRTQFHDCAEDAVARQNREGNMLAMFLIDLDGFKQVNDALGHRVGDLLLTAVAGRLLDCVRASDTLARLGGDEFALLSEELRTVEEVKIVARRITLALEPPFHVDGRVVTISGSVGVALRHPGPAPVDDMIQQADNAMYAAKLAGKRRYVIAATPSGGADGRPAQPTPANARRPGAGGAAANAQHDTATRHGPL
jgi:diguanylate cyclase (GGDEF)-like protein